MHTICHIRTTYPPNFIFIFLCHITVHYSINIKSFLLIHLYNHVTHIILSDIILLLHLLALEQQLHLLLVAFSGQLLLEQVLAVCCFPSLSVRISTLEASLDDFLPSSRFLNFCLLQFPIYSMHFI